MTETHTSILKAALSLLIGGLHCAALAQGTPRPVPAPATPGVTATPQPAPPRPLPAFYRNLVVLDPAHGGPDAGAQLANSAVEKNVTLTFAQRLRPALTAQGFTVVMTRDSDPANEIPTDQRAGIANHDRPIACIVIHASSTGTGVHLISSSLPEGNPSLNRVLPWSQAQAAVLPMSLRLANEVGLALDAAHVPVLLLRASVPPIDNLICPSVAIEIAPLKSSGNTTAPTDVAYQQRIINAIATGLASFRTHNAPSPTDSGSGPHAGATQ
ncbi:N-acetylmuramoyl-L-alanine amidase [Edaphobacter albus]|uniref:N-acetylmuramoyl-L-alanine amidase n=1 Tax=Edaphobacter sp. 4G125 TaxID=2763071 RepID=UPI00164767A5|nr:N-acetylmuramoyl-L-alanine amidase [Edaphobacter sp. 4G125]QNI38053.1 N-acetylmuramoyl-L-alanine amidase [Edaphobacter sp. 4G125]